MITFIRTAVAVFDQLPAALAWSHQVANVATRATGSQVHVMMPLAGNPNRIAWTVRFENLAALEAAWAKQFADPTYFELLQKGGPLFIQDSGHDEVWQDR